MGQIYLVASGKGGVGKTTVTANIAACLAKSGNRVLCFDADLSLGNLDIVIYESNESLFCLSDVAKTLGYSNPTKVVIDDCKGGYCFGPPTQSSVQPSI